MGISWRCKTCFYAVHLRVQVTAIVQGAVGRVGEAF